MDPVNPAAFFVKSVCLSVPAWVFGRAVDRTVGRRGMVVRIAVNAVFLWCLFALLPPGVADHVVISLPGAIAGAAFFNTQRWDATKLV